MEKWQIYLQEVKTQVEFAQRSYIAYEQAKITHVVADVFFHLHHFVVHTTNIDKILDAKPNTPRHMILADHVDLAGVDLKSFRRLRNHLEHFDERLDKWAEEYDGYPFFDMNIVTGAKGFPQKAFLRALDGDTFKFYGEDYNMKELFNTVIEINRRLES